MSIDRRLREDRYLPKGVVEKGRKAEIETRKALFGELNKFITAHGGWVVSIPGNVEVVFEVLPDSLLSWMLIERGWVVVAADPPTGTRIIAGSVTERLTLSSSGGYEPLVEGSTKAVALTRHHSGICQVQRYQFGI